MKKFTLTSGVLVVLAIIFLLSIVSFAATPKVAVSKILANRLPLELKLDVDASITGTILNSIQDETVKLANSTLLPKLPGGAGKYSRILAEATGKSTRIGTANAQSVEVTFFLLDAKTYTADVAQMNYVFSNGRSQNVTITFPTSFPAASTSGINLRPDSELSRKASNPQIPLLKRVAPDFNDIQLNRNLAVVQLDRSRLGAIIAALWPQAVANTPCPDFPSAVAATNQVYDIFRARGLTAKKMIGAESTKADLMSQLKNNTRMLAWNNIGHGWTGGIVQWDAAISASDITASPMPSKGIYWAVCLLNSCQVFNDPLRSAMRANQPRTFIGGLVNLPVARSESVDVRFWYKVLLQNFPIGTALVQAAAEMGLTGYFGIEGYTGVF